MNREQKAALWLAMHEYIGAIRANRLRELAGSYEAIRKLPIDIIREEEILKPKELALWEACTITDSMTDRMEERLDKMGIRLVIPEDPDYPKRLKSLRDSPAWLFARGSLPYPVGCHRRREKLHRLRKRAGGVHRPASCQIRDPGDKRACRRCGRSSASGRAVRKGLRLRRAGKRTECMLSPVQPKSLYADSRKRRPDLRASPGRPAPALAFSSQKPDHQRPFGPGDCD